MCLLGDERRALEHVLRQGRVQLDHLRGSGDHLKHVVRFVDHAGELVGDRGQAVRGLGPFIGWMLGHGIQP